MTNLAPIMYLVDKFMIPFLEFSYTSIFPNYGVAIILLTLLIKLFFFPLMNKQYGSMKAMQEINPLIKDLRDKHKDDPKKLQTEMMRIYKENNVNPLQGCLPMIIQIPFFLAIYSTILSDSFTNLITAEGANQGLFSFWLPNLAVPDSTYILPVILAIFTYYSQKLIMVDPQQQKFLVFSPILILVFGLKLASGVLLYWAVSTVLSTVQQVWIMGERKSPKVELITQTKK